MHASELIYVGFATTAKLAEYGILSNVGGLRDDSTVLMEQITTIDKRQIIRYLGSHSSEQMKDVSEAIRISFALDISEEMEAS